MGDAAVYKSTHPDVLAAWEDSVCRHVGWVAAVKRFAARWPGHQALQTSYPGHKFIVGLDGTEQPGPEWRWNRQRGQWVPDKRNKAGKALSKEMNELAVQGLGKLPGMPSEILGPGHMYSHGVDVWDRVVWVSWNCGADLLADIDLTIWEPGKLSEYYAAKEQYSDGDGTPNGDNPNGDDGA